MHDLSVSISLRIIFGSSCHEAHFQPEALMEPYMAFAGSLFCLIYLWVSGFPVPNRCFYLVSLDFNKIWWIGRAAGNGNILSQRDGSDGPCRRFRFRNRVAKECKIHVKSGQKLAKDEIKTKSSQRPNKSPETTFCRFVVELWSNFGRTFVKLSSNFRQIPQRFDEYWTKVRRKFDQSAENYPNSADQNDKQGFHKNSPNLLAGG